MSLRYERNKKFCLASVTAIQEICQSVFQLLGVHGFTFHRMYANGERLYFSSSAAWIENFYQNNYFAASGFKKSSKLESFSLWAHWPKDDESFLKVLADAKENFNYGNGLVVNRVFTDYIDAFAFRGFPSDTQVNNRYLNEFISINKFLDYFIIKSDSLIVQAKKISILIPEKEVINFTGSTDFSNRDEQKDSFNKLLLEQRLIYYENGKKSIVRKEKQSVCVLL